MELKELSENFIKLFGNLENFKIDKLTNENCSRYLELINEDLETDYLQKIWQFYMADREDKKQDFTPKSLAKLVSELTKSDNEEWVYDMCSGSGALTIQKWVSNKSLKFVCEELDENIIPFLLFNLKIRNIEGYVINGNILTGEKKQIFKLSKKEKFSEITSQMFFEYPIFSTGISNPPFNLSGVYEENIKLKNMNYVFILKMLDRVQGKVAFILPNGVMTSSDEEVARKYLLDNKKIRAVVSNPERTFESTSIPTCILYFEDNSKEISLIDCRAKNYEQEEREQKGEQHTKNRVYKKILNVYSDENIKTIKECILNKNSISGFCKTINISDIEDNNLQPSRYIEIEEKEDETRSYKDIISDLDRVIKQQNSVKLVINETWARECHLDETVELLKQGNEALKGINNTIKKVLNLDTELELQDYIKLSKSKEMKFENVNKSWISPVMRTNISQWHTMIYFFNEEQNRYLKEFRDKLLNDLVSGKIDVSNIEI